MSQRYSGGFSAADAYSPRQSSSIAPIVNNLNQNGFQPNQKESRKDYNIAEDDGDDDESEGESIR
jgi:hypothetical protein